ncbi:NADPH:quinone reductase [Actinoplanes sp. NPDC049265]|uniref:NADPH:quinone reductase n=1 Tax=Actinoplanes sp. NPDC049265 TaxID=3363902 RepID=UPI0037238FF8
MPPTMPAAYVEELGPPGLIRYGDLPVPRPGPTDVLVRVELTVVNRVDTFVRSGVFGTPVTFPFVIGRDCVGTVIEAGPGAPRFDAGDRVWCNSLGHGGRQGPSAAYAVIPADRLYHLPPRAPAADAVAVVHPAVTAYLALHVHAGVRPGETVLVAGAAGNVGSALTVLAARAGARVIALARPADEAYCRSLGAAEVLDFTDDRLARGCGAGVDVWLDTWGSADLERAVNLLAFRGRVILLAGVADRPVLPAGPLYMKDASVRGFVISHATTTELAEAAVAVNDLLSTARLRPRRLETMPLSAAAEAHRRVESAPLHGTRLVLQIDP